MKKQITKEIEKEYSDLYSIDDFIEYYKDASKRELKERLKTLEKKRTFKIVENEIKAISALLC